MRPGAGPVPRRYRALLAMHPRWWRLEHGEVVLTTQLAVDQDDGRDGPTLRERFRYAADGLRVRLTARSHPRRFAPLGAFAGFHLLDQGNGTGPSERVVPEQEQRRANRAQGVASPMPQSAWGGPASFIR